jgi:hypothetical protein
MCLVCIVCFVSEYLVIIVVYSLPSYLSDDGLTDERCALHELAVQVVQLHFDVEQRAGIVERCRRRARLN